MQAIIALHYSRIIDEHTVVTLAHLGVVVDAGPELRSSSRCARLLLAERLPGVLGALGTANEPLHDFSG